MRTPTTPEILIIVAMLFVSIVAYHTGYRYGRTRQTQNIVISDNHTGTTEIRGKKFKTSELGAIIDALAR